ncbi:MAG TPA: hypothetical protein VMZ22_02350 [Acidimicrobiales bacterium]|nr:hypothetical protein [Acidimicrobiales bacterium]
MKRQSLMRRTLAIVAVAGAVLSAGCGGGPPRLPLNASGDGGGARNETAGAADMSMRVANVRYELAEGVKADKDKQEAHKLAGASADDAQRLAKAFGVEGEVRADEGGWTVGATGREDQVSPDAKPDISLYVAKNGSFSMNGSYPVSSGVSCVEARPAPDAPADKGEPCAPTTTTTRPPNMPTEAEARQIAERALTAAGIDVAGLKPTVESLDQLVSVRFQRLFDGQPVDGYEYSVTVNSEKGIAYANGYVGEMKAVGTYDLATLERAVERLNEEQVYPGGGDMHTMTADASEPATAPDGPGAPEQSEPTVIKLTAVRVGLMMTFEGSGGLWLTPAYVFTTDQDGGGTILAAAADDKYLPPPTTVPAGTEPDKTEPGVVDGGGSEGSDGSTGSGSVEPSSPVKE